MPTALVACPACSRHLLAREPACPFCGESLHTEPEAVSPKPGRAAAVAGIALAAAITAGSGALVAHHAGVSFVRASPIVDLDGVEQHAHEVDHVAVPPYGVPPPPDVFEPPEPDPRSRQ